MTLYAIRTSAGIHPSPLLGKPSIIEESFKYDILYSSRKLSKSNLGQRSFGEMPFLHQAMSEKGSGDVGLISHGRSVTKITDPTWTLPKGLCSINNFFCILSLPP